MADYHTYFVGDAASGGAVLVHNEYTGEGWEWNWHHLLPQGVFDEELFARHELDMDICDAKYGWMLRAKDHFRKGGIHSQGWNADWERWIARHEAAGVKITKQAIEKRMGEMIAEYGLAEKGFRAEFSYNFAKKAYKFAQKMAYSRSLASKLGYELSESVLRRMAKNAPDDILVKGANGLRVKTKMKGRVGGAVKGSVYGGIIAGMFVWATGGEACEIKGAVVDSFVPIMGELGSDPMISDTWDPDEAAWERWNDYQEFLKILAGPKMDRLEPQLAMPPTPSGPPSRRANSQN